MRMTLNKKVTKMTEGKKMKCEQERDGNRREEYAFKDVYNDDETLKGSLSEENEDLIGTRS